MITDLNKNADSGILPPVTRERRLGAGRTAVFRTVVAGLVLFLGGAVAGGGAMVLYFKRAALAESPMPEKIGSILLASLEREFTLTPQESEDIRKSVAKQVAAMDESSRTYGESVRSQFGELCGNLCGILGPERAKKWREIMRRDFGENAVVYIHTRECPVGHGEDCQCLLPEEPGH